MSQTPHPHDPYGTEPGTPASDSLPEQPAERPASDHLDIDATAAPAPQEQGSATSDPAEHPYDPFAQSAPSPQPAPAAQRDPFAQQDPYAQPGSAEQADPYGQSASSAAPAAAPASPYGAPSPSQPSAQPAHAQQPYGQQQAPHAQQHAPYAAHGQTSAGGTMNPDQAPAHVKGVFDGPLIGQPTTESDTKLWAMFAQLSAIVGYVIGAGFLGWLGPLIIFLVYKDRNRFVRYNAAEALNAAIATLIVEIVLAIVFTIITVITFGFGSVLFALIGVPALVHVVFAIIGAVKAYQGEWWNYPVNIRLVK
ncbi:DUF4870 domain-containing protein [Brachybacterium paraconglomeratum]|uniref:DUF4870 domain-containing protein n=1 Tax=Brachybacterium paraconglomeratum TaxID=173362 RepID=UPI0022E488CE|nr:DUF4870 domain-containing protein [Brachybacterium paraconglomeratum]